MSSNGNAEKQQVEQALGALDATLIDRVAGQAIESGWTQDQAATIAERAREPFFSLMNRGVPAPLAYMEAYFCAEKFVAKDEIDQAVAGGTSAEAAFADIVRRKRQGRSEEESPVGQAAVAAFNKTMSEKGDSDEALFDAYDAAAQKMIAVAEATMPEAA